MTTTTITKQLLKTRSGEFDIESIHSLVLRGLDLDNLGCIGECTNLERLDLSRNDFTKLIQLSGLTNLTTLNLSANRISSVEGLQSLDKLKKVNLAGNLIGSLDILRPLAHLEHLEELRLKDTIHDLSNPVCSSQTYKEEMKKILPNLKILDGERLGNGKGTELFRMCDEIDRVLAETAGLPDGTGVKASAAGTPWVHDGFWENKKVAEFDATNLGGAEQQLEALLEDCRRVAAAAETRIHDALSPPPQ